MTDATLLHSDSPQTVRLRDQLSIGVSLFGWLALVFLFLMLVMSVGASLYSRIYEHGRSAGTQDLIAVMERLEKLQKQQVVQPPPIQTAPTMHAQPSPFESVCRNHNGVKSVTPHYKSVTIVCHDQYTVMQ